MEKKITPQKSHSVCILGTIKGIKIKKNNKELITHF